MSYNLLITGATGFIGGFLAQEAIDQGYKVFAAVRASSDTKYLETLTNISIIEVNLADPQSISNAITTNHIDYIINNAGLTRSKSQDQLNKVNASYLDNLFNGIKLSKTNIKRVVHVSSLAAYGPADYTKKGVIKNSSIPHPVTMYGKSKLLGESIIKNQSSQPYVIIRPTAVYGPKEKDLFTIFKMINGGLQTKVGFSPQKLTFIYVKDLVVYMINALTQGPDNEAYFISDGKYYSNHEFNELVKTTLQKKTLKLSIPLPVIKMLGYLSQIWGNITNTYPPLNIDKVQEIKAKSWVCDTSKNINLGYTPKYSLEKGIEETVAWYKNNNWL